MIDRLLSHNSGFSCQQILNAIKRTCCGTVTATLDVDSFDLKNWQELAEEFCRLLRHPNLVRFNVVSLNHERQIFYKEAHMSQVYAKIRPYVGNLTPAQFEKVIVQLGDDTEVPAKDVTNDQLRMIVGARFISEKVGADVESSRVEQARIKAEQAKLDEAARIKSEEESNDDATTESTETNAIGESYEEGGNDHASGSDASLGGDSLTHADDGNYDSDGPVTGGIV